LHEEQNRLASGTTGTSMTAVAGSTAGISGSSTSGVPVLQREPLRRAPAVAADLVDVGPVVGLLPRLALPAVPRSALPVVPGAEVAASAASAIFPHTVQ
jgi:hypothetical protein